MTLSKETLLNALPIVDGDLTIRAWTREDVEVLSAWASYAPPHDAYNLPYRTMSLADRESRFTLRDGDPRRVDMVVDLPQESVVAYVAIYEIDWTTSSIGNMTIRIAPSQCDNGLGTRVLRLVSDWCLATGIKCIRLDIPVSNPRSVRCYEKVGFVKMEEGWNEHAGLLGMDLSKDEYALLRQYMRNAGPVPEVRVIWMERRSSP